MMESGWRIDVVVPEQHRTQPMRLRFVAAISDQEEAKARIAREAVWPTFQLEIVKAVNEEMLADIGLEPGEVARLEQWR
jgi:hypothetical protein